MRSFQLLSYLCVLIALAGCAAKAPPPAPLASAELPAPLPAPPPQQQVVLPLLLPPAPQPDQVPAAADGAFFRQTGLASFYGRAHDGNTTANGRSFDHREFTAAHRSLPFGTKARVTNLRNGRSVTVEITDRGPHVKNRIIDVSLAAARALGMQHRGIAQVKIEAFRADQAAGG